MLFTIVKKEILESLLSYRLPLFLLVGVTLIPLGLYMNEVNYSKRLTDYEEQVRLENKALTSSQMWDVLSGTVPLKGFLRPAPLLTFAQGLESSLPQYYEFKQGGYKRGELSISGRSMLSDIGPLDFAFIVQMVISLVVLMFGADVISGEKELGTLRAVLSNSVPRDTVLLGKLVGGYAALWFPFFVAFIAGILVLSFTPFPFESSGILLRIMLIFLASSLFILVYFSIGIMVSTSTARTRTSLVAILVVWAFFQLIIPKASSMVASIVYPIKTEAVVSMEKSLVTNTLEAEKSGLLGKRYEEIFGGRIPFAPKLEPSQREDEWNSYKTEVEALYVEKKAAALKGIDDKYEAERGIQQRIETAISMISPGAAFDRIITDLCGTGECDKTKYIAAVQVHQQVLDKELFDLVRQTPLIFAGRGSGATVSVERPVDLSSLPSFSVKRAGLSEIFDHDLDGFVSLAFWLVASFGIAFLRFLKYDVR